MSKKTIFAVIIGTLIGILFYRNFLRPPPPPLTPIAVEAGQIQGKREGGLAVYRGIPFAAPPVGDSRWRAPQPVAKWDDVRLAEAFGPDCMQSGSGVPGMPDQPVGEDCLTLNIWAPPGTGNAVMVYLSGGGFLHSSGSSRLYWGDRLASQGVVVVTLNYRVGAFGFLAHPDLTRESGTSGNYALLDVVAALKWVQANIAQFGGDPGKVTLFGQSAGAYLVSELMVSPPAAGLFQRAILQSGADMGIAGAPGDMPLLASAEIQGVAFGASIADLRKMPAQDLLAASEKAAPWLPTIDGKVLPDEVHKLHGAGWADRIAMIVGTTEREGADEVPDPKSAAQYVTWLDQHYGAALAEKLLKIFPAGSDQEAALSQERLATADTIWRALSLAHAHHGQGWLYNFSRVPPWEPFKSLNAAAHGAELAYVFGYPPGFVFFIKEAPWRALRDLKLAGQMQSYWTNFAKTGDPNASGLPPWPLFSEQNPTLLDLGDETAAHSPPAAAEFDLFNSMREMEPPK